MQWGPCQRALRHPSSMWCLPASSSSQRGSGRLSSRQRKVLADKDSAIRKIQAARKRQSKKQEGKKGKKGGRKSGVFSRHAGYGTE
jgi:hypothetical protein